MSSRSVNQTVACAIDSLEPRTLFAATFTYSDLAALDLNSGAFPQGSLVMDANGDLFGTASKGGDADPLSLDGGDGTVFEWVKSSNQIIAIATFDGTDGRSPNGLAMDSNGDLIGVTREGGDAQNDGTLFRIALSQGSQEIQTLALFDATTGIEPNGSLTIDANGNIFGTAPQGGVLADNVTVGSGTVWELASGASTITTLATFDPSQGGGANPHSNVVFDSTGKLFVSTAGGGASGNGTISTIVSGQPAVVASFDDTNGRSPLGNIAIDNNDNLFGTAAAGAAETQGALWELPAGGETIQVVASFDGDINNQTGAQPDSGVTFDGAGNLFGTAVSGGKSNGGTIWELPSGTSSIAPLVQLSDVVSTSSGGPLLVDEHGNLFGTARTGGANGLGKVFELTTSEPLNPVHLAFSQEPTDTTIVDAITPAVTVQVLDANNNLVTAENAVSIAIASGPSGAVLGGTTTVAAIDGVATFDTLALNTAGTYTLVASDGAGTTPATSDPFNVIFPGGGNGAVTAAIQRNTLPSPFVPGDRGVVTLQLQNAGDTLARGVVKVQLLLSPDGQLADAVPVAASPALANVPAALLGGRARPLIAPFIVPANVALGAEQLIVALTPVSGFASSSVNTAPIVDTNVEQAALNFGGVGARRNVILTNTSAGGTTRFILAGPGTGALLPDGAGGFTLSVTGTTAATNVIIIAPPGGATLNAIQADSAVGLLVGRTVTVTGNVTLAGGARTVLLANVSNSTMTFGGATPMVLSLGNVTDSSIRSSDPLNALVVNSWTNTGTPTSISAASIRVMLDRGAFAGNIATQSITTAIIKGDLRGDILAGTAFGPDNEPGGGDDTFAAGSIGTLLVSGSVNSSVIAAGLNVIGDSFPLTINGLPVPNLTVVNVASTSNFTLIPGSSIRTIAVGGTLSNDSLVLADTLPARARIGPTTVVTANDPRFLD